MRTTRETVNKFLLKLKKGDDCLEAFIDYSRGYLQYIAYKYLIDKSLVEDVIFLAYDKIIENIKTFDNSKNGLAWIVKITQNEALRLNRDETTRDIALEVCESSYDDGSIKEEDLLLKYNIEKAISRLNEEERTIIEYKIFIGMTIREIAGEMNMPKSTVAYIFKQALNKLKNFLS